MAYTSIVHKSIAVIRDGMLDDQRRMLIAAGVARPNLAKGSERWVRAESLASAIFEGLSREVALQDAQMEDSATGEDLDRLAARLNITRSAGAGATGNVVVSCTGSVVYPAGLECTSPDGLRYQVVAITTAVDGGAVPVAGIDTGKRTDKTYSTIMTWTSPPAGSATTATVDASGLRFGADADDDARLRRKVIDRRRHPAKGGNWSHVAGFAEDASSAIEKAFAYPAVYGPSTHHVAITVPAAAATQYTRAATGALMLMAATGILSQTPEHADLTLTTVTDYDLDLVLQVELPEPKSAGGIGGGWVDALADRWPTALNAANPHAITLNAAPTNPKVIVVVSDAAPVLDAHIALWSNSQKKLVRTRVYSYTGAGPYTITLYDPIDINDFASGDYVMPDAENLEDYCSTVASQFALLGPGEKTAVAAKLPRSYRHPLEQEDWHTDFTSRHVGALSNEHTEVQHVYLVEAFHGGVSAGTLPIACPDETTTGLPPNCLRLGRIGFYEV